MIKLNFEIVTDKMLDDIVEAQRSEVNSAINEAFDRIEAEERAKVIPFDPFDL